MYKTLNDIMLGNGNFRTDNVHYAGDNFDFYKKCLSSKPTTYQGSLGEILERSFSQNREYDDTFRFDGASSGPKLKEGYQNLWKDVYTKGDFPVAVIPPQAIPSKEIQPISSNYSHTATCDRTADATCGISLNVEGTCSKEGGCGKDGLYPLLDPKFNMREVAKQLILLEDHCFHPEKQCQDCIKKHALAIEGFLEEAITLDKKGDMQTEIRTTLKNFREIVKPLVEKIDKKNALDYDYVKCAQDLRYVRKPICQNYAGFC